MEEEKETFLHDEIDQENDLCEPNLICPRCKKATMEMDSMMNLVCPSCGYSSCGGST